MAELMLSENERIRFDIPKSWTVLTDFSIRQLPVPNITKLMEDRIDNPINTKRLEELIKPNHNVVILIDDYTRATPHQIILSFIVNKLEKIGLKKQNINIIVASGTHSHLDRNSLENIYGKKFVREYNFTQHDSKSDKLVKFTQLSDGTPVKINPLVAKSDFCIGIGVLEPHPFNGFGGGGKIIFPGVVDYYSIVRHHGMNYLKGCGPGNITKTNYFYNEINAVAEKSKLQFIINFILNEKHEAIDIVAGNPFEAFIAGVELVKKYYGINVQEEADITITSGYPYDVLTQTLKPISTAWLGTKEGGEVIIVAKVKRGPELEILDNFREIFAKYKNTKELLNDFIKNKLPMPGAPIDMNVVFAFVMDFNSKVRVTYVTKDLDKSEVTKLGFQYASSIKEAIARSYEKNQYAKVNIYREGGFIIPLKIKTLL